MTTHKEMTAHIRNRLKQNGVKALCSKHSRCGTNYITIAMTKDMFFGDREWSADDLESIAMIASSSKLTGAQKSPIYLDVMVQMTGKPQFDFEFHGDV